MKAARKLQRLQQPQSLLEFVRQFLTPQVWKQARQAVPKRRSQPRWDLQPLVLVLLAMTWTAGDSELERFEAARGFYVMSYEGRKRPGKTLAGFQKALARLPMRQLWALAQGVRDQIQRNYAERLVIDGLIPMGCDGSRVECPRARRTRSPTGKGEQRDISPDCLGDGVRASGTGVALVMADRQRHRRRTAAFAADAVSPPAAGAGRGGCRLSGL